MEDETEVGGLRVGRSREAERKRVKIGGDGAGADGEIARILNAKRHQCHKAILVQLCDIEPLVARVGEVRSALFKLDADLDAKATVYNGRAFVIGTELPEVDIDNRSVRRFVTLEDLGMEGRVGLGEEGGVGARADDGGVRVYVAGDGVVRLVGVAGAELEGALVDGVALEHGRVVVADSDDGGKEGSNKKSKEMHGGESGE